MTDVEILRMKLNLTKCSLDDKQKEEFLTKLDNFHNVFSLRDEIGTCPFIEVHLKLKDKTPFFVRPYPMQEEQKKVIQKEMDRQLTGCPSQKEKSKFVQFVVIFEY